MKFELRKKMLRCSLLYYIFMEHITENIESLFEWTIVYFYVLQKKKITVFKVEKKPKKNINIIYLHDIYLVCPESS